MERDLQRANVEKLKAKMNRKAADLNEAWNREQELQEKITKLQDQVYACLWELLLLVPQFVNFE